MSFQYRYVTWRDVKREIESVNKELKNVEVKEVYKKVMERLNWPEHIHAVEVIKIVCEHYDGYERKITLIGNVILGEKAGETIEYELKQGDIFRLARLLGVMESNSVLVHDLAGGIVAVKAEAKGERWIINSVVSCLKKAQRNGVYVQSCN